MAGIIKLEQSELKACASHISKLNDDLENVLISSKNLMNDLSQSYQGEDATAIISAYNEFSDKYSKQYKQLIQEYVDLLNEIAENMTQLTGKHVGLATRFD